ncbi:hypothetical protein MmiEs2_04900 [Methanimicrococcus stummii]|uniref:Uncharacterized protein n=1 Tax=Methanimicrococcus stummii TaxID=3028294 RepID=A0AA96V9U5_9EURY|nr:hypothetical protein [Methanimicrococcus sp. Es2]WNY28305.1 hypothetical protein MmiEs2_04900 [Methanimicrococcus sp. Es2]
MGFFDTISKTLTQNVNLDQNVSMFDNLLGGGIANKTQDQRQYQNTQTTYTTNYNQNTYDYSVNMISDSPFASLKKGDMGTLAAEPTQNVSPSTSMEAAQTSKTDMTGLLVIGGIAVIALYAYKEFMT